MSQVVDTETETVETVVDVAKDFVFLVIKVDRSGRFDCLWFILFPIKLYDLFHDHGCNFYLK